MTNSLPPLHENDNGETRPADSGVTRPTAPLPNAVPPRSNPQINAPTPSRPINQPPPRGAHIQPTGAPPRRPPTTTGQRPVPRAPQPQDNALYLPWWSLVLMLLMVMAVVFGVVAVVLALGSSQPPSDVTPIIRIITAQPTLSSGASAPNANDSVPSSIQLSGANPPSQLALEGPTLPPVLFTPTPLPITLGSTITVRGVSEQQLNVRDSAGVQGTTVLFRSPEGTNFTVVDGPSQADGFTWWKIQNVANPSQSGWAVANYLQVVVGGN